MLVLTTPSPLRQQLLLALCVLIACLLSIASRPAGYSAAVWLSNALLIGLLLRNPPLARLPGTWLLAFAAYCAADLLVGSSWAITLGLNTANLCAVAAGWYYFSRPRSAVLGLRRQRAIVQLIAGSLLAAAVGAVPGSLISHWAFHTPLWETLLMWLSSELYDMLLVLPLLLVAPRGWFWQWQPRQLLAAMPSHSITPLLALIVSEAVATALNGPGVLGFSVPALIWCALAYGVFPTTVLNFLLCTWKTVVIAQGTLNFLPDELPAVASFRIGIALISLAPLAVALTDRMRTQTLARLQQTVNYDDLTGALSRRTLMERGHQYLRHLASKNAPAVVLLLDLDHFKRINDTHGHAQGDAVLRAFAAQVRAQLRPEDLFGRIGGEEFVLLLPRTSAAQALQVIARLRAQLRAQPLQLPTGESLIVAFSAGLRSATPVATDDDLEHLLSQADTALYQAKAAGRDRVHSYETASG